MIKKFCDACGVDITDEDPLHWLDVTISHHSKDTVDPDEEIGFELHLCENCIERNALAYLRNKKTLDQVRKEFLLYVRGIHDGRKIR